MVAWRWRSLLWVTALTVFGTGVGVGPGRSAFAAPSTPAAAPSSASPTRTVDDVCKEQEAKAKLALDKFLSPGILRPLSRLQADGIRKFLYPLRHCIRDGRGAWFLSPRLGRTGAAETLQIRGTIRPTYIMPDGRMLASKKRYWLSETTDVESKRVRAMPMMDYDADGIGELILRFDESGYDEHSVSHVVLTVRDSTVVPYPPLAKIVIDAVGDFDRDGRIDVLTHQSSPWRGQPYCFGMGGASEVGLPPVLYHAREDGSFSDSDDVAADYLRTQCPKAPAVLLDPDDGDGEWEVAAHKAISCARLHGESVSRVKDRLRREWPKVQRWRAKPDNDDCGTTLRELQSFATIEPPVTL